MYTTKHPFAISRQCPVVGHDVELSGLELRLADGSTEMVKKTCVKYADCYRNQEGEWTSANIVPIKGCLLGDVDI